LLVGERLNCYSIRSARTGTLWDDYMDVIPIIATYGKKIMDFDEDGPEFKRAVSDFEKQFRPGEKEGITDSFFMSWMYFSSSIKAFHLGKISKGKLAEYVGENYSAIPSFSNKYGYDENEDYSFAYRTT